MFVFLKVMFLKIQPKMLVLCIKRHFLLSICSFKAQHFAKRKGKESNFTQINKCQYLRLWVILVCKVFHKLTPRLGLI